MPTYQVATLQRPPGWQPRTLDDVPPSPGELLETLGRFDQLWPAIRCAVQHNRRARDDASQAWAVVVEPGTRGQTWATARLCTPISYHVRTLWWPDGWEPVTPVDVPACQSPAESQIDPEVLTYQQAVAKVWALNQQSIHFAGSTWYVVVAVENEPAAPAPPPADRPKDRQSEEPMMRPLHVVQPEVGGPGDCSHCPARSLPCSSAAPTRDPVPPAGRSGSESPGAALGL
ncbi:MAG TPA: hypothetical protein EYH34_19130 [Planctomycetes bacterium]|nr:hypothetical protein [Planctomycetota bacterium]